MTTEAKQSLKNKVLDERNTVIKHVNDYITWMSKIESEYEKYFAEIKKHSSDFTLTKTVKPYSKNVYFRKEVSAHPILVDTIHGQYNECRINYVGKFPEKYINTITIGVEEHKTSNGRLWSTTNHGFKLKLRFNYGKEMYYKSVKTFVKKITDFVDVQWASHNHRVLVEKKKTMALNYARVQFNTTNIIASDSVSIRVKYDNGAEVIVYHNVNVETGEIKFTIKTIIPPKNTDKEIMINFINSLGSL